MRYGCLLWAGGGFLPMKMSRLVRAKDPLEAAKKAYEKVFFQGLRATNAIVTAPDGTVTRYHIDREMRKTPDTAWAPGPHFDLGGEDFPSVTHDDLRRGVAEAFASLERAPKKLVKARRTRSS